MTRIRHSNRKSWSSSGGDTTFYDAEEPGSRMSFATAAEDFLDEQREVPNAFSNGAFQPDDDRRGDAQRPQNLRQKKRRKKPRFSTKAKVDGDSATAAAGGDEEDEEDEDDFGFRFMPAIPPPRQLKSPDDEGASVVGTLTLKDALDIKMARDGQRLGAGIMLETNIDQEIDDNSSIPSSYRPRRPNPPPPANNPVASFAFNAARQPGVSDASSGSSTATAVDQNVAAPQRLSHHQVAQSTLTTSPAPTVVENGRRRQMTPTPLARLDTDFEADTDAFDYTLGSPEDFSPTPTLHQASPSGQSAPRVLDVTQSVDLTSELGRYVLARPPPSAGSVPEFLNSIDELAEPENDMRVRSLDAYNRAPLPHSRIRPGQNQRQNRPEVKAYTPHSLYSQNSGQQVYDSGAPIVPVDESKAENDGGCCSELPRRSKMLIVGVIGIVVCCCLLAGAVVVIAVSVANAPD